MSRVISRSSLQLLLDKINHLELQCFLCSNKLQHLGNQLDFVRLCYKREILGLSDQEEKDCESLSDKIKNYEEVEIQ